MYGPAVRKEATGNEPFYLPLCRCVWPDMGCAPPMQKYDWVRRGLGILCFALALVPVFFLAGTAGVRQETPYEFELESMEEAYTAREFLEEEADYYSLESTMRSSGLWDDTYGQYWEILYAAQLNAQRQHLLAAVEAGASGQSEYAALAQQAGSALEELAGRTQYPENRTLIENWAN